VEVSRVTQAGKKISRDDWQTCGNKRGQCSITGGENALPCNAIAKAAIACL
jgi:hypothetical protein